MFQSLDQNRNGTLEGNELKDCVMWVFSQMDVKDGDYLSLVPLGLGGGGNAHGSSSGSPPVMTGQSASRNEGPSSMPASDWIGVPENSIAPAAA